MRMLQRTCADGVVAEYPERPCRGVRLAEFERDLTRERGKSGIAEMSHFFPKRPGSAQLYGIAMSNPTLTPSDCWRLPKS